ncbi:hypothetical protein NL676_006390 [Syzygium grande]|nr:hypothetical protein NL676_006390 [Syzygium grande]
MATAPLRRRRRRSSPEESSPIEQVALTVPAGDDPSLPSVAFRTFVLGTLACCLSSPSSTSSSGTDASLSPCPPSLLRSPSSPLVGLELQGPFGSVHFDREVAEQFEFDLRNELIDSKLRECSSRGASGNSRSIRGPFNVKEHVLITIFANSGAASVYAIQIISAVKILYRKEMSLSCGAGRRLDDTGLGVRVSRAVPAVPGGARRWPQNLVQVSLFRCVVPAFIRKCVV